MRKRPIPLATLIATVGAIIPGAAFANSLPPTTPAASEPGRYVSEDSAQISARSAIDQGVYQPGTFTLKNSLIRVQDTTSQSTMKKKGVKKKKGTATAKRSE